MFAAAVGASLACDSQQSTGPPQCDQLSCGEVCDADRQWCWFIVDEGNCPKRIECSAFEAGCAASNRCECVPSEHRDTCADEGERAGVKVVTEG